MATGESRLGRELSDAELKSLAHERTIQAARLFEMRRKVGSKRWQEVFLEAVEAEAFGIWKRRDVSTRTVPYVYERHHELKVSENASRIN